MNVVYKITFCSRKANGEKPFAYIGSKHNCTFDGKRIYDKRGKIYAGSVASTEYKDLYKALVSSDDYVCELLEVLPDGVDARNAERAHQLKACAVESDAYFNKVLANEVRSYDMPGWCAYKHALTGKIVKLPVNSKRVTSGEYVGVNKGITLPVDVRKRISKSLKKHYMLKENRDKISRIQKDVQRRPEVIEAHKQCWTDGKRKEHGVKLKATWTPERHSSASVIASARNNKPEFKEKFRKSRSRGTWVNFEQDLKRLWETSGKPGYVTFRKIAVANGFADENYAGAVRSWSGYYKNKTSKVK